MERIRFEVVEETNALFPELRQAWKLTLAGAANKNDRQALAGERLKL
jgi:hypothetical protein